MPEPKKLRKQYVNNDYPHVMLRFEDGHEIQIPKGVGKAFDAWQGDRDQCGGWLCKPGVRALSEVVAVKGEGNRLTHFLISEQRQL